MILKSRDINLRHRMTSSGNIGNTHIITCRFHVIFHKNIRLPYYTRKQMYFLHLVQVGKPGQSSPSVPDKPR